MLTRMRIQLLDDGQVRKAFRRLLVQHDFGGNASAARGGSRRPCCSPAGVWATLHAAGYKSETRDQAFQFLSAFPSRQLLNDPKLRIVHARYV